MNPLCSLLIPTRGRPESLQGAIDSFLGKASEPHRVEVVVRVHEDDVPTSWWTGSRDKRIRVVMGDSAEGYGSMDKFLNCIAAVAEGDWLFGVADDFRMLTQDWDRIIEARLKHPRQELRVLTAKVVGWPNSRIAIMSRGLYHAVGHMGRTEYADSYMDSLTHFAGLQEAVPILMEHFQGGLPPPVPRDRAKTWAVYRSHETAHDFRVDKTKLGAVIGRPITEKWTPLNAPEAP